MPVIAWLGGLVAAIVMFAIGAVWYSPALFAKRWQREVGVTMESRRGPGIPATFGGAFVLQLLGAWALSALIGPDAGALCGALFGLMAGALIAAGSVGVNYLYEGRSLVLFAINGGYNVVTFTAAGAILGAMFRSPAA